MAKNDREFKCEADLSGESLTVNTNACDTNLEITWRKVGQAKRNVFLNRESCEVLAGQLRSFHDHGRLLPGEPPEPTSNAKATARALLAAVGLEVELDQIRVIQETTED